jgi:ketosteroid isomerase-like protein
MTWKLMAAQHKPGPGNLFAALLGALLLVAPFVARASEPAPGGAPSAENALAADQALVKALRDNDVAALGKLLGDDWVVVSSHGDVAGRGPVLAAIKSGAWTHNTYTLSDPRVKLYGTVAVITTAAKTSGTFGGKPFEVALRQTDVLVWRNGAWHAVLMHESELRDS